MNLPLDTKTATITGSIFDLLADVDNDMIPNIHVAQDVKLILRPNVAMLFGPDGRVLRTQSIPVPVAVNGDVQITVLAVDDERFSPRNWGWDVLLQWPSRSVQVASNLALTAGEHKLADVLSLPTFSGVPTIIRQGEPGPAPTVTWDGSRIVVNGVPGPDLRGPAGGVGKPGEPGEPGESGVDRAVATLTDPEFVDPDAGGVQRLIFTKPVTLTIDAPGRVALTLMIEGWANVTWEGVTIHGDPDLTGTVWGSLIWSGQPVDAPWHLFVDSASREADVASVLETLGVTGEAGQIVEPVPLDNLATARLDSANGSTLVSYVGSLAVALNDLISGAGNVHMSQWYEVGAGQLAWWSQEDGRLPRLAGGLPQTDGETPAAVPYAPTLAHHTGLDRIVMWSPDKQRWQNMDGAPL